MHIVGGRSELGEVREPGYVRIAYCDRMDLAIAASDLAVARAGASTVSEFSALGLPAIYVPYAVGNGEQAKNASSAVSCGAAVVCLDKDFSTDYVASELIPLASNSKRLKAMREAAKTIGIADGTERLYALVRSLVA